jgi:hypothetical protein
VAAVVKLWRISSGRLYINVGMADVFQAPKPSSPVCEVLIIVAAKNIIDRTSIAIGNVSQAHFTSLEHKLGQQ